MPAATSLRMKLSSDLYRNRHRNRHSKIEPIGKYINNIHLSLNNLLIRTKGSRMPSRTTTARNSGLMQMLLRAARACLG